MDPNKITRRAPNSAFNTAAAFLIRFNKRKRLDLSE